MNWQENQSILVQTATPDYGLIDPKWNFQAAGNTRGSYKFVLFPDTAGNENFSRERFLYAGETKEDSGHAIEDAKTEASGRSPVSSLLKIPITQLLQNIEDDEKKAKAAAEAAKKEAEKRAKANIQSSSSANPSLHRGKKRLIDIYAPKDFLDLVGSDKTNRFAMKWLKSWQTKVFKRGLPKKPLALMPKSPDKNENSQSNFKKKGKFVNEHINYFENLSLFVEKDIAELNGKMLLLSGPSGSGKSTLASIIGRKCDYNPYRLSLANETSLENVLQSIRNIIKGKSITETTKGPTLLILDDIDGFFAANQNAANKIVELLNEKTGQGAKKLNKGKEDLDDTKGNNGDSDDEGMKMEHQFDTRGEETKTNTRTVDVGPKDFKSSMTSKRPVIFICDDPYSKGLKPLKNICHHFRLEKSNSSLVERLKFIVKNESLHLDLETINAIATGFDNDISSCLNFIDLVSAKCRSSGCHKSEIMTVLRASQTSESQNKSYYDSIKWIFNKPTKAVMFKTGEANCKDIFQNVLNSLEGHLLLDGLFVNYTACDHIEGGLASVERFTDSIAKGLMTNQQVRRHQLFQLERYMALPALFAFMKFFHKDYMKVNYISEISSAAYERRVAENIFAEMRSNLPPLSLAYTNKQSYREQIDYLYRIIQPHIDSNFVNPIERKSMEDAILLMIQNGISFAPSNSNVYLTNKLGNSRRAMYEPAFEKYLIYADELPKLNISEIALRHMQSNFQYMIHVHEAGIKDFEIKTGQSFDKENSRNIPKVTTAMSEESLSKPKDQAPILGNVYGSLKRHSRDTDQFVYEFFEGSTNKIKCPVKFSALLDLFSQPPRS